MATKTAPAKGPSTKKTASRKAGPAARKTRSTPAAASAADITTAKPAPRTRRSALPLPLLLPIPPVPSPAKVVKTVAKVIEDSPVGKAGAVTSAVLRSRRAAQLSRRVRNKHVVVTGASSGIGLDCALKLGAAGATVILAARTPSKLQDTVDRIRADGGKAFAYACDLSDMGDCDRFIQQVLDEHRHVDILINNAGRSIRRSVKHSFDRFHDFERTMQLNYFGALRLIFGFAPKMLERKSGHIINISSIGVLASPPRFSAYVASKAALDAFSWCAAPEFADAGVRFTTINMPLVRTPMIAPTKLYDAFPTLSPDEAAELVMSAVIDKPKRVATGLGLAGAVAQAVAPGVSEFILNQAFRLFPDSPAARGLSDTEAEAAMAQVPKTPVDMARKLFAQVFSGVHW
jgi:NAD(P)-dependent dehydrogenase (short-subunit alcohol dehydrogenase family)